MAPGVLFDPRRFAVDVIEHGVAKAFIERHHYAGTFPSRRLAVGLFGVEAKLVGVAVFSNPSSDAVVERWTGMGTDAACELGRFVCLPDVAYNGETWFLARAVRCLVAEKAMRAFVSFADPVAWHGAGPLDVVKPEHWGTIYQASNAMFCGRSTPRTHLIAPDGRPISPRALSKLRALDRGWQYTEKQLLDAGAPRRRTSESTRAWLARVRRAPGFRSARHPGNLAYVFGLDDVAKASIAARHAGGLPYPKKSGPSTREAA